MIIIIEFVYLIRLMRFVKCCEGKVEYQVRLLESDEMVYLTEYIGPIQYGFILLYRV